METSINNKCKAFTSIEQSELLAEILPIESADMWYCPYPNDVDWHNEPNIGKAELLLNQLPCWSLATLINIIPVTAEYNDMFVRLRMDKGHAGHAKYAMWYDDLQTNLSTDIDVEAENFIDACVEMIIKLHKEKLL